MIAPAAEFLFDRTHHWQRWKKVLSVLVEAMCRDDVIDCLAAIIKEAITGPRAHLLRTILRTPAMDRHLLDLSRTAILPNVPAHALRTLIEGRATWPNGTEKRWIDKTAGRFRQVTAYATREMARPCEIETLVVQGAHDKSIVVRRVAADGLIRYRATLSNMAGLVSLFADDPNPSIRERVAFLIKDILE